MIIPLQTVDKEGNPIYDPFIARINEISNGLISEKTLPIGHEIAFYSSNPRKLLKVYEVVGASSDYVISEESNTEQYSYPNGNILFIREKESNLKAKLDCSEKSKQTISQNNFP
jgi:hypothetical protein